VNIYGENTFQVVFCNFIPWAARLYRCFVGILEVGAGFAALSPIIPL
jgi:hypothetical protein